MSRTGEERGTVSISENFRVSRWIGVIACVLISWFIVHSNTAQAISTFGERGDEAGQFTEPEGVAVDQTSGDVYVVDSNNQRVEKFTATGNFLLGWGWGVADGTTEGPQICETTCLAGIEGSGAGQFNFPAGVAVDNSASLPDASKGDVYVVDVRNNRVEKFSPAGAFLLMFGGEVNETTKGDVCLAGEKCEAGTEGASAGEFEFHNQGGIYIAVGPTGTVYVGDQSRVQEFDPEGVYKSQITLEGAGHTRYLAVDEAENIYVKSEELSGIQEYNPSGTLIRTLDIEGEPQSPTLDSSGDLFIAENASLHIFKYDSSGSLRSSFSSGSSQGMAFGEDVAELYVINEDTISLVMLPPPGPLVESESAPEVLRTTATVSAKVNAEGHEASNSEEMSYHFDYGETESYGQSTPTAVSIGGSFEDRTLNASLKELQPRTTYHFRVVATNAANETVVGPDEKFTTLPPALIDSESATSVTSKSVTLDAQINPLGSNTEYRFEYDTSPYESSTRHGRSVPIPDDIVTGAGEVVVGGDVQISEHVQDLLPGTVYHYRVVVVNSLGEVVGSDRTFETQQVGESLTLPDGRRWELVSPPDKHGATIEGMRASGTATQTSAGGGAMTYTANAATEANAPGDIGPEREQVLSTRTADGWVSRDIATPHNAPTGGNRAGHESEYVLFSSDLSLGIVEPGGETPLSPETSERTPYLRDDTSDSYQPLITAVNAPGVTFGKQVQVAGATPDLSHIVVTSKVPLTASQQGPGLYEWTGARLQPVSVLPNHEPPSSEPLLGHFGASDPSNVRHAISNDGSRVVWEAEGHLYLRDMGSEETAQLDVVEAKARGGLSGPPVFQTASSDGSKIFFTDSSRLTVDSKSGGLYEYEVTNGVAGRLRSLNTGDVTGMVLGASEDGSYLYLVSGSVLTEVESGEKEKAAPGANNLYVLHENGAEWTATFIAQLSNDDINDWSQRSVDPAELSARVSPNGHWLAFMSDRSLTGYDNHDAVSEKLDEEVFLYDATSGRLACASCNPDGARPMGAFDRGEPAPPLIDNQQTWRQRWLAGMIPEWTPYRDNHALYQSRYLSDSGRLFFNSADALVSQDINGTWDVYMYEPTKSSETTGSDNCTAASSTHSQSSRGCVNLISSGTSAEESIFLDASESGDDVFFLTAARLVPEDFDMSLDVYDAHVCSSTATCLPPPSESPPACTSSDACRTAPSSQPSIFGPSASATFAGVGNIAPSKAVVSKSVCKRGFIMRKIRGKASCVRRKRKTHRAKRHRAKHGARARIGRGR